MAAGSTYTPIATTTLGSAASSYTFTSISGSYTDLVIICGVKGTADTQMQIRFNSDTGTNYSTTLISGNGTSAESARAANQTKIIADYYNSVTTSGSIVTINVMNYSNSTTYKTALVRANAAATAAMANVGLWRNTAAITSIELSTTGSTFAAGSTFTLYGIAAA